MMLRCLVEIRKSFNGHRPWPLHVVVKKFTFAISSPDEFLFVPAFNCRYNFGPPIIHASWKRVKLDISNLACRLFMTSITLRVIDYSVWGVIRFT